MVSNTESEPVSFQTFSTEILAKVEETASYAKPILKSSIPVAAVKNTDLGAIVKDLDEDLDDLEDLDDAYAKDYDTESLKSDQDENQGMGDQGMGGMGGMGGPDLGGGTPQFPPI